MDVLCKLCYIKKCFLVRCVVKGSFVFAVALFVIGCIGSGVSYSDKDKCLIVVKNNAVLSYCDTVIGDEIQVDSILLKKGRDGLSRHVYFNVFKDSHLSISGTDFRLDFVSGLLSFRSMNEFVLITNRYDRCSGSSVVWNNDRQFVINDMYNGRITYFAGLDVAHVIWIDVRLNDEQHIHIPMGISGVENKDDVLLSVKRREKCDIVIQENLYEFGTF